MTDLVVPASPANERTTTPAKDIRAAMSVSNLLTPPTQVAEVAGPGPDPIASPDEIVNQPAAMETETPLTPIRQPVAASSSPAIKQSSPPAEDEKVDVDVDVDVDIDVPEDDIDREFHCANDPQARCVTGQYTLKLARKVISDHFGRNKACTRQIKYWPLTCRKHYQRATYGKAAWQARKITLIMEQFDAIDQQFPGTLYNVTMKKSEEQRLNLYSRKIAQGQTEAEAKAAVEPDENNRKSFEAPIKVLCYLEAGMGENKTIDDVKETVSVIRTMFENGETLQIPSIEFLPQLDKAGKPTKREPKVSTPKTPKKKAGSRVSESGGIQKPTPSKPSKSKLKSEPVSDSALEAALEAELETIVEEAPSA